VQSNPRKGALIYWAVAAMVGLYGAALRALTHAGRAYSAETSILIPCPHCKKSIAVLHAAATGFNLGQ